MTKIKNQQWYIGKEILITGGTGSLGKTLVKILSTHYNPKGIRIYSRDEFKQFEMKKQFKDSKVPISYLIGDVRDENRLSLAMKGVDVVIHTAAMKHIPSCEYNPLEAIKTNILGSMNVVRAALNTLPLRVMNVSTDKAVSPLNLYGMTKGCSEKLFIHSNVYGACRIPRFSCCRYGNVLGSRGSVIPLFREQIKKYGTITLTDKEMTRFWISLDDVAEFLLQSIVEMKGEEIFIPKMSSAKVIDIIEAMAPGIEIKEIGVRKGEKLHEVLINKQEWEYTLDCKDHFKILNYIINGRGIQSYNSKDNINQLSVKDIRKLLIKLNI